MSNFNFASYEDVNPPYASDKNTDQVLVPSEEAAPSLSKWFTGNQMKANDNKFHLIIDNVYKIQTNIGNINTKLCCNKHYENYAKIVLENC